MATPKPRAVRSGRVVPLRPVASEARNAARKRSSSPRPGQAVAAVDPIRYCGGAEAAALRAPHVRAEERRRHIIRPTVNIHRSLVPAVPAGRVQASHTMAPHGARASSEATSMATPISQPWNLPSRSGLEPKTYCSFSAR